MTIERKEMKKRRTKNSQGRNKSVDRLSSLPSDILIGIISLLPLRLAITTGSLSRRWRNLWTNTTSIDIAHNDFKNLDKVGTGLNEIMTQITSPVIHSFRMDCDGTLSYHFWVASTDTLIRQVCDRNVRQFKVTWSASYKRPMYTLRRFVFKTQSLVSVELGSTAFSFETEQILSNKENASEFDGAISNVRYLTLDVSAVDSLSSTVFRNATRLTLDMKLCRSLNTLSSIIEACPVLEVLTLNVWCVEREKWLPPKPDNVSTLRRSLKRINIEIDKWDRCCKPAKSLLHIVEYLLRDTPDLERVSVIDCTNGVSRRNVRRKQEYEFKLCKLLYWCPMVSTGCDVEFKGRILNMSRKDGPKVTTAKGKVMFFLRSPIGLNYKQH